MENVPSVCLPMAFAIYAVNAEEGILATCILPRLCKDVPTLWRDLTVRRQL